MSQLPGLVLALLSLLAWTAAAESPSERRVRVRRVPFTGAPVDVRVAPGIPTTLNFDADMDRKSVALDAPGRVKLLSVGERALTFEPLAELDKPVTLRVRYADPAIVGEPVFSLSSDPAEVDAQIKLFQDANAPEALRAKVAHLETRCTACEAELAAQRARGRFTGPTGLVLSRQLDTQGVKSKQLTCPAPTRPGDMMCERVERHLAAAWLMVGLNLRNPPGQPVWKPGTAWLVSESTGERLEARVVSMEPEALAPDTAGWLAVEFAQPPEQRFRLEVREADGPRHFTLGGITVEPPLPPPSERHRP